MASRSIRRAGLATVLAVACTVSAPAVAGSGADTSNPYSVGRQLRFQIDYPSFLRFRIGSAAAVDLLDFDAPVGSLGTGVPVSASGGDAGPSSVTVLVVANTGVVTIGATNNSGGLGLGTGTPTDGYISYGQITTTSSSPQVPSPALANSGVTSAVVAVTSGTITSRAAVWTFAYANTTIPTSGVYGTSANGGRVTYTASTP